MVDFKQAPPKESRLLRFLAVLAWVYLATLVVVAVLVAAVGEATWISTVLLYVPTLPLLLPLLGLVPLAFRRRRRITFAIQAVVAIAIVLVLSGPHISFVRPSGGPTVRVFSYNVFFGRRIAGDAIEREIETSGAGIVLLQAMSPAVAKRVRERLGPAWSFASTTEFFLASRYPIVTLDTVHDDDRYQHHTLETPLGVLDVFNMHPYSPRTGLFELKSQSKKKLLTDGPSDEAIDTVEKNTRRREAQVAALVAAALAAAHPVVIAGDTNLPEWSGLYRKQLARWQDGFSQAGTGLGYTFPANRVPWMRIDRVLAGPELKFTSFTVGGKSGSDHCPVWADLEKR